MKCNFETPSHFTRWKKQEEMAKKKAITGYGTKKADLQYMLWMNEELIYCKINSPIKSWDCIKNILKQNKTKHICSSIGSSTNMWEGLQ